MWPLAILFSLWGLPATVALLLTWRELRQREASLLDRYALGGTAVCVFWPVSIPLLFFFTRKDGQLLFP